MKKKPRGRQRDHLSRRRKLVIVARGLIVRTGAAAVWTRGDGGRARLARPYASPHLPFPTALTGSPSLPLLLVLPPPLVRPLLVFPQLRWTLKCRGWTAGAAC
jgi:hypothetical protein